MERQQSPGQGRGIHAGFMRLEEVLALAGCKRSTWYSWIDDGEVEPLRKHPKSGIKVYRRSYINELLWKWDDEMEAAA